jgi:two-component system response regulator PrrA
VEDDACLRRLLRLYLGKSFEGTDWEAGDAFLASLGQEPPDLVVMDLNLRGLSGIEVIQAIRKRFPDRKRPGILLVSGIFSRCSEPELAATGADDSLGKPFTHREFLDRIYKLLDRDIN